MPKLDLLVPRFLLLMALCIPVVSRAESTPATGLGGSRINARPLVPRELFVEPSYVDTIRTSKSWMGKDAFFGVGYSADFKLLGQKGLQLFLGSQGDLKFGYFFRLNLALANFGVYRARADTSTTVPTGLTSVSDLAAEVNRARFTDDPWVQGTADFGVQSNIRLLSGLLPKWSQVMRHGLGYGYFRDSANAVNFLGFYYAFDAAMQYHFSEKSSYALEFAAGARVGEGRRIGTGSTQDRRLPMLWSHFGLNLFYYY